MLKIILNRKEVYFDLHSQEWFDKTGVKIPLREVPFLHYYIPDELETRLGKFRQLPEDEITTKKVSEITGINETTLYQRILSGRLEAEKVNGKYRFDRKAVENLLSEQFPVLAGWKTLSQVSEEYDVNIATLHHWKNTGRIDFAMTGLGDYNWKTYVPFWSEIAIQERKNAKEIRVIEEQGKFFIHSYDAARDILETLGLEADEERIRRYRKRLKDRAKEEEKRSLERVSFFEEGLIKWLKQNPQLEELAEMSGQQIEEIISFCEEKSVEIQGSTGLKKYHRVNLRDYRLELIKHENHRIIQDFADEDTDFEEADYQMPYEKFDLDYEFS